MTRLSRAKIPPISASSASSASASSAIAPPKFLVVSPAGPDSPPRKNPIVF